MNTKKGFLPLFLSLIVLFSVLTSTRIIAAEKAPDSVRSAAYQGTWYPGTRTELEQAIRNYLNAAQPESIERRVVALISPHAGYRFSGQCAAYPYKLIAGKKYDRVFILGISHRYPIRGCAVSQFDYYETLLGKLPVDRKVCDKLLTKKLFTKNEEAERREHSLEMQIPFLQMVLKDFSIVPLIIGELADERDYEAVASALKEYIDDKTLVVVSSDMTHYGANYDYVPFTDNVKENLKSLDYRAFSRILDLDFRGFEEHLEKTGDTICGNKPIGVLLKLLGKDSKGILLKYYTSGEMTGDFSNSVSYAGFAFVSKGRVGVAKETASSAPPKDSGDGLNKEEQRILLTLARKTIIDHLTGQGNMDAIIKSAQVTERMKQNRGVFVTIKKQGDLRGCIGYIEGIKPLYQAVIDNAISASTRDYRFLPMTASEIDEVKIEISVMTPLVQIGSIDEIKIGQHGLYLEYSGRHAVFLPQVATENNWNRDQFLDALCRKAGLPENTWKVAQPRYWVFTAQVFGEE